MGKAINTAMADIMGVSGIGWAGPVDGLVEQMIMISSGTWIGLPLDLSSSPQVQITLVQASYTQDYSLRYWISLYPFGVPLAPPRSVMKTAVLPVRVCVPGYGVEDSMRIEVAPGVYILNVYNLTNQSNLLEFTLRH